MKKLLQAILGLALIGSMAIPASAAPVPDHIHRLWDGIRHLRHAHTVLDTEAGTNYGGHRENAERDIDAALNELSAAVEYFRTNVAHEPNPFPAPNLEPGEPGGGHYDHIRRLERGLTDVRYSRHLLDGMAGDHYGGHRANAERDLAAAEVELQAAISFYQTHRH